MKIAKREDFALIFMSELSKHYPGEYVSLGFIAHQTNLSPLFLKHIASVLLEKNLIESKEGISGGYRLHKPPQKITVSEIIKAISKGIVAPSCVHGGVCRLKRTSCSCLALWDKVNRQLYSYLDNISLEDFGRL
ncbi:Rrf2 family transcriptional regulator [Patescibacteria group bacterium]|nr:Rrf2 family transcriptional regulator [Patescibacteria group bacterium]MCL5797290.1 Rrf2 family transcriptional regulator [Patescibacteria group bacterium]